VLVSDSYVRANAETGSSLTGGVSNYQRRAARRSRQAADGIRQEQGAQQYRRRRRVPCRYGLAFRQDRQAADGIR
jgi:hypothetical protein